MKIVITDCCEAAEGCNKRFDWDFWGTLFISMMSNDLKYQSDYQYCHQLQKIIILKSNKVIESFVKQFKM